MIKRVLKLKEYIDILAENDLIWEMKVKAEDLYRPVALVTYDSREAVKDTLFICKGLRFNQDYLKAAIAKGCFCYVSELAYDCAEGTSYIIVNDIRRAIGVLANAYFNDIWKNLHTVGLTGTKGKSTTAFFIRYIFDEYLKANGKPASGILSSIDNYDGVYTEESHLTTPETLTLHRHFENMVDSGIEYMVMEVSSQALKYHRSYGVNFEVGCFLNISEDHISDIEHKDYEDYFTSKLRLFHQCRTMLVNHDCDEQERLAEEAKKAHVKTLYFGTDKSCDFYGHGIRILKKGIEFKCRTDSFDETFRISLPGGFNVENALAAIGVAYVLNIPLEYIKKGLAKAKAPGRMEVFESRKLGIVAVVDYAHNSMSFKTLFKAMRREYPNKKISIVFGCPGNKAVTRRRELGEIAGEYADMVYLTEEDYAEENIADICAEIEKHVKAKGCPYKIIYDRKEAIRQAVEDADGDCIILITGKGRETRMKRGTEYIDTPSDVDYITEFFKDK